MAEQVAESASDAQTVPAMDEPNDMLEQVILRRVSQRETNE
jgi:hypothetical protein